MRKGTKGRNVWQRTECGKQATSALGRAWLARRKLVSTRIMQTHFPLIFALANTGDISSEREPTRALEIRLAGGIPPQPLLLIDDVGWHLIFRTGFAPRRIPFLSRGRMEAEAWEEAGSPSVISCSSRLDHSHNWLRGVSSKLESKSQAHGWACAMTMEAASSVDVTVVERWERLRWKSSGGFVCFRLHHACNTESRVGYDHNACQPKGGKEESSTRCFPVRPSSSARQIE
jgi:hypothetical protein